MPLRLAAMALRIAGPMTGNSASASGCGFWRTEVVMASSIVGASARVRCGSCLRRRTASGSTALTSRADAAGIVQPRLERAQLTLFRADDERPQLGELGHRLRVPARRGGADSGGFSARGPSSVPGSLNSPFRRMAISVKSAASAERSALSPRSSCDSRKRRAPKSSASGAARRTGPGAARAAAAEDPAVRAPTDRPVDSPAARTSWPTRSARARGPWPQSSARPARSSAARSAIRPPAG